MTKLPTGNHKAVRVNKKGKYRNEVAEKAKQTYEKVFKGNKITALTDSEQVKIKPAESFRSKKSKIPKESSAQRIAMELKMLQEMVKNYIPDYNSLIVDDSESWISQIMTEIEESQPVPLEDRRQLKDAAAYFYDHDIKIIKSRESQSSNSSDKLRKIVLSHGTAKDVVSALASYCLDSPIHSLHELQRLVSFVNPKRKQKNIKLIDYLETLFKSTYLLDGYVAKEFECHSFSSLLPHVTSNPELVVKQLLLWYFEDQIRMHYLNLIENLSLLANAEVSKIQLLAIAKLSKFLAAHPKQDAELCLQKVINKLGDQLGSVAGGTINLLRLLQSNCPEIKPLLVSLIHTFLHRKGITERTQFYGLCVLKDITLTKDDPLAERLIDIYFQFFTGCIKKGSVDNRFMSCLLRGINQAFTKSRSDFLKEKLDTMYIMCNLVSFNRGTQVAQLIYQTFNEDLSDRYFNLLYKMILNPDFGKSSSISSFLNLLYKSLVRDTEMPRIQAFFKRMLHVSMHLPTDVICGVLKVISEIIGENNNTKTIRNALLGRKFQDLKKRKGNCRAFDEESEGGQKREYRRTSYDMKCLNPLYARAELTFVWELHILQHHYHPSVRAFVSQLFTTAAIDYSGDPFIDFANIKLLNRYSQKKAKKITYEGNDIYAKNRQYMPEGARRLPVDSKEFCRTAEEDIAVDERFFHKYYNLYKTMRSKPSHKADIDDDEFERVMKEKHFSQYVDPDLREIDFTKSAVAVGHKGSAKEPKWSTETSEDFDDDAYEEESDEFEDEDQLVKELDDARYEDEDMEDEEDYSSFKGKYKSKHKAERSEDIDDDELESADEFSAMLESNATNDGFEHTTSDAIRSHSSSGRQSKWEAKQLPNRSQKRKLQSPKLYKKVKKNRR